MTDEDETPTNLTIACPHCGLPLPLELAGAECDGRGIHALAFGASVMPPPPRMAASLPSALSRDSSPLEREREEELRDVYARSVRNAFAAFALVALAVLVLAALYALGQP